MSKYDKETVRTQTIRRMQAISPAEREVYQHNLFNAVLELIEEDNYQRIGVYYGFEPELETPKLIELLHDKGFEVYLPRMQPQRHLSFHLYTKDMPLEKAYKGLKQPLKEAPITEPNDIDLFVIPGVAFTLEGDRVGFGAGYYDRFLANVDVPTVSLIFPEQLYEEASWSVEDHDQPIGKIIVAQTTNEVKEWQ